MFGTRGKRLYKNALQKDALIGFPMKKTLAERLGKAGAVSR